MECSASISFGPAWVTSSWALFVAVLFVLFRVGTLQRLRSSDTLHCFFGAILFLTMLWSMRFDIEETISFHFLGLAAVTLILKGNLALLAGGVAQFVVALIQQTPWSLFPLNYALAVVIPVATILSIAQVERNVGSRSFFAYIFFNAFFGAAIAMALSAGAGVILCWWLSQAEWSTDHSLVFTYLPLILLPEGVINGMIVTGLLVFAPHLLTTFDSRRYK